MTSLVHDQKTTTEKNHTKVLGRWEKIPRYCLCFGVLCIALHLGCGSSADDGSTPDENSREDGITAAGGLTVALSDIERELPPDFNCYNQGFLHFPNAAQYDNSSLHEAIAGMHTKLVRYPGGTNSTYWDWQRGGLNSVGAQVFQDSESAQNFHNHAKLASFASKSGVRILHVLNYATSTLDKEMQRLRDAESKGMAIEYVELDNELYSAKHNRGDSSQHERAVLAIYQRIICGCLRDMVQRDQTGVS